MKKFLAMLLLVGSIAAQAADVKISCVDEASFHPIKLKSKSCVSIKSELQSKLYLMRRSSELRGIVDTNGDLTILGNYQGQRTDLKEEITKVVENDPQTMHISSTAVLSIEYDSDGSAVAAFGGEIGLGEMDSVAVTCIDVSDTLRKLNCKP